MKLSPGKENFKLSPSGRQPTGVEVFTTTGANTWTRPGGAQWVEVWLVAGGGGGGSGRRGAAASERYGGGGGASANGANSGAGGAGANGVAVVISYF